MDYAVPLFLGTFFAFFIVFSYSVLKGQLKLTFNEEKVTNPFFKFFVVFVSSVMSSFAVWLSPILVPLHFVLRKHGRNGFRVDGSFLLSKESFEKYEQQTPNGSL